MDTVELDAGLYRTDVAGGPCILTERLPGLRSVAVGVWVRTASAHEPAAKMGVSHLLEHMVFKGTERRSAREIALELESRGGALDAFTGRDQTAFQARVLDEDLPRAVDILTDLVRRPALREQDLALERQVVLEEISMVDDTPDDLVFDLHARTLWDSHPYGYRILGTRETVGGLQADDLRELHRRAYVPRNCVIAAVGCIEHETLLELLGAGGWLADSAHPATDAVLPPVPAAMRGAEARLERPLQQTHVVLGTDTVPYGDQRRFALTLVSTVLGGGMSSQLFQRVREELGLAYSVYSFHTFYVGTGIFGVYVGTTPATAHQAVEAIRDELRRLAREGVTGDALRSAKQQLKGQVTLSIESPTARMYRLAGFPLYHEPYRSLDDLLATIEGLSEEDVAAVAREFFDPDRLSTVWLGPSPKDPSS